MIAPNGLPVRSNQTTTASAAIATAARSTNIASTIRPLKRDSHAPSWRRVRRRVRAERPQLPAGENRWTHASLPRLPGQEPDCRDAPASAVLARSVLARGDRRDERGDLAYLVTVGTTFWSLGVLG